MKSICVSSLLASSLLCGATSWGAILAQYDFEGAGNAFLAPNASTSSLVIASDISANTATGLGNNFSANGFVRTSGNPAAGLASLAIQFQNIEDGDAPTGGTAGSDNITFTLLPAPGQILNLGSLSFLTQLNGAQPTGAFYTVQYDDLSDAAGFQFLPLSPDGPQTEGFGVVTTRVIDLSSSLFDNLSQGITFRINVSEPVGTGNTGSASARIDNITVYDSVIPEPATAGLVLLGGVALAGRRRRE
jgi:hypothetical protein